ncbi:hypothetical protein BGZ68_000731 [Mortierella alpina]|nr:hypothetical protein BGZ68_000731 [Mortierella alpina]
MTMGPSDVIPDDVLMWLKGNEPETTPPIEYEYLVYMWRGYHDYLWFRVDRDADKVVASDWYHAYEAYE